MFQNSFIFIYFFYGLAFFILGLVAWIESRRKSQWELIKALPYLGLFGVLHACGQWVQIFEKIPPELLGLTDYNYLQFLRIFFILSSFVALFIFGLFCFYHHYKSKLIKNLLLFLMGGYLVTCLYFQLNYSHTYALQIMLSLSRYSLAIPSGILAGIGLWKESKAIKTMNLALNEKNFASISKSLKVMGTGFFLYALLSIFSRSGGGILNSENFFYILRFPIELARALIAIVIAFNGFKALSVFEYDYRVNLQARINSLEILSLVDEVSGLHNHRFLQESLKTLLQIEKKEPINFSLLLIDIDYFKEYNDKYGHPEGDKLLNEVGRMIRSLVCPTDIVARYGGDELAVILQNTHLEEAYEVAEKIRRDIGSHHFSGSANKKITLSIGIANCPMCAKNKEELIQVADTALYKAKLERNKTECHTLFNM